MHRNGLNKILFDPGGSNLSFKCSQLFDLKSRVYETFKSGSFSHMTNRPLYSSKTLIGNWFEERSSKNDTKNDNTTFRKANLDKYAALQFDNVNRQQIQSEVTEMARQNKASGQGVGRDLIGDHGEDYLNNYSTSYDLCYRVLPHGLDGPKLRSYNLIQMKWGPEEDLTRSYGNITRYGMVEYLKALDEEMIRTANEKLRSNYQCEFTRKKLPPGTKRYVQKRFRYQW